MEIKTVRRKLDYVDEFDTEVNNLLRDGWRLVRRDVLQPPAQPNSDVYFNTMLYAELVRDTPQAPDEPQAITWQQATRVLSSICKLAASCKDCPMYYWCDMAIPEDYPTPAEWEVPEDGD